MSTETIKLNVTPRTAGKGSSRNLRAAKSIPAIVYGPDIENMNLQLEEKVVVKYSKIKFENTIFELASEDKSLNGIKVLRKETAIHPLSRRPVHVDFYAVDMSKTVKVHVELVFQGDAIGVKEGGIMNILKHTVEVEAPVVAIPQSFVVDVTNCTTDHTLHVSDITGIPSNIKLLTPPEEALVVIATTREEKKAEAEEETATEEKK